MSATKLHRPRVTPHLIARPRLMDQMDGALVSPLSLICASAGYGKTTLVSAWVESLAQRGEDREQVPPAAWLSLDEQDSDLTVFLRYFCAALQEISPADFAQTLDLLRASQPPPLAILTTTLANELEELPTDCILVLDDYHTVSGMDVPDLLAGLFRHWPSRLHLVLVTRRSPPLALPTLRAKGSLTEIRGDDLRFSAAEVTEYVTAVTGMPAPESVVADLERQTEGWAACLHLALLSPWPSKTAASPRSPDRDVNIAEYLFEEFLSHQPADILAFLLQTALLDKFSVPLCEEILQPLGAGRGAGDCVAWLERAMFPIVMLDDRREWYRYHHLMQSLLRSRALMSLDPDRAMTLRRAASSWFRQRGLAEEALGYALAAGDMEQAATLMAEALRDVLNREDRPTLERWLLLLPDEFRRSHPAVLMIQAWLLHFRWRLDAADHLLEEIEALIAHDSASLSPQDVRILRGQMLALRAQALYTSNRPAESIACAEEGLALLPHSWTFARGLCMLYLGGSMHTSGDDEAAERALWASYEAAPQKDDAYALRILFALAGDEIQAGRLEQAQLTAQLMLEQARRGNIILSQGWANLCLGLVHYQWNDLAAAVQHFQALVQRRYSLQSVSARQGMLGLVRTQLAQGNFAEAGQTLELLNQYDLDMLGFQTANTLAEYARWRYLQGDADGAWRWAEAFDAPVRDEPLHWLANPHVTKAYLLLGRARPGDAQLVLPVIEALYDVAERTHNTHYRITVLALRALAFDLLRHDEEAQRALRQALALAQPGGFIRALVDAGPRLQMLLRRVVRAGGIADTVRQIVTAFGAPTPVVAPQAHSRPDSVLLEPLSSRELEILVLMAERLSNKEIAARLFISPQTVKRHATNAYAKLGVGKRAEAVAQAELLGILPPH